MTKRDLLDAVALTLTAVGVGLALAWEPLRVPILSGVCGLNLGMMWSTRRARRRYLAAREDLDAKFAEMDKLVHGGVQIMGDMVKATRPCPSCGFCQLCGEFHEGEKQALH